jgi:hypothetical protein
LLCFFGAETLEEMMEKLRQFEFEFECEELEIYMEKILKESDEIINKIIREKSPLQVGDTVQALYGNNNPLVVVSKVSLYAVSLWGGIGKKLSFGYEGKILGKNGMSKKNLKPINFSHFVKDEKINSVPSYFRTKIDRARMY